MPQVTMADFRQTLLNDIERGRRTDPLDQMYNDGVYDAAEVIVMAGATKEGLIRKLLAELPDFWPEPTLYAWADLDVPPEWVWAGDGWIRREWVGRTWFEQPDGTYKRDWTIVAGQYARTKK